MSVVIGGSGLDRASLLRVARGGEEVVLAPDVTERMQASRQVVERALDAGVAVHGLSTVAWPAAASWGGT